MGVDVAVMTVIERPLAEVAAYSGDPTNAPEWRRHIERAEWETDPPVRLGSRVGFRAALLGRSFDYTADIVELTPGEQVAIHTVGGPLPLRTTIAWRPVGHRVTHVVMRQESDPPGLASIASPLIGTVMRRMMEGDLDELKRRLEGDR